MSVALLSPLERAVRVRHVSTLGPPRTARKRSKHRRRNGRPPLAPPQHRCDLSPLLPIESRGPLRGATPSAANAHAWFGIPASADKSGPDKFCEHASLHALPGCISFEIVGEPTLIAGTQTRGALASVAVDVSTRIPFRHASGFERVRAAGEEAETQTERYLFQLAQERRPPMAGCWLVTSLMPARDHMLFNGDTGAVQG